MKKWYKSPDLTNSDDLLYFLNKLDKRGVKPTEILISSSSFGDTVFYYSEEEII